MRIPRRAFALSLGAVPFLAASASAQQRRSSGPEEWPRQAVRLVVPFAAGGSTDVAARILAERMGQTLGQAMVVENRGGSAGLVGAEHVAKAPPDGHTLLMATTGLLAIAPHLYPRMPFDPARDFAPVSLAFATDLVITVTAGLPVRTLRDLIGHAKERPGALSYASSGAGTTTHAASELFRLGVGIDILHVPYRGHSVGREIDNANGNPAKDQALTALPPGLPRDWGCEAETGIFGPVFPSRRRQRGLDREAGERRG